MLQGQPWNGVLSWRPLTHSFALACLIFRQEDMDYFQHYHASLVCYSYMCIISTIVLPFHGFISLSLKVNAVLYYGAQVRHQPMIYFSYTRYQCHGLNHISSSNVVVYREWQDRHYLQLLWVHTSFFKRWMRFYQHGKVDVFYVQLVCNK
jgi:hypothetical protein